MKTLFLAVVAALLAASGGVAAGEPEDAGASLHPFESGTGFIPRNTIDVCVQAALKKAGIEPSNPCSDDVFLRRVYIDVTGTLPHPLEVLRFKLDRRPEKRAALIDVLLATDAHVDYVTLKWGDLLRVKAEFPINLWPNGVQAYHRWIRDAVKANRPYDQFARALLTSSGSNFRVPPVNFYRAVQSRTPSSLAAAAALTFMGVRTDKWPAEKRKGVAAFFSRITYKKTAEWKEEVVINDPAPSDPVQAVYPDGKAVTIPAFEDPRRAFADWLLAKDNPWFARAMANRAWSWFMGRGVVHEPDDLRPDNPPASPELLTCLERELVASGYDLKRLFRLILNSRTYQGSPIPTSADPRAEALFAHYKVRRLDAEVLIDALCRLNEKGENYVSIVPEPFTILPDMKKTVKLSDGTITSMFLEMFGRPARDTGVESERNLEPTDAQRLHLLNSSDVMGRILSSPMLRRMISTARNDRARLIRHVYVFLLSREPTPAESTAAKAYFNENGRKPNEAVVDLAWALINSKEFLYRH